MSNFNHFDLLLVGFNSTHSDLKRTHSALPSSFATGVANPSVLLLLGLTSNGLVIAINRTAWFCFDNMMHLPFFVVKKSS